MSNTKALAVVVRDFVARKIEPTLSRIKALEDRAPERGEKGDPGERGVDGLPGKDGAPGADGRNGDPGIPGQAGKSAYQLAVERGFAGTELQWLDSLPGRPGENGRDGINGKDADPVDLTAIARAAAALIPAPQDGRSVTLEDIAPLVATAVAERVAAIPAPVNGRDADPEEIAAAIEAGIAKALPGAIERAIEVLMPELIVKAAEAVPRPRDGVDAVPVDTGAIARDVLAMIPTPRDGVDGKSVDEAEVISSLTEKMLRAVDALPKAKDGRDGRDASSVLDIDAAVARAVALLPAPKDGKDAPPVDTAAIVREVVSLIPAPKDGRDADSVDVDSVVEKVVALIPKPRDGVDGKDAPELDRESIVREVVASIPVPRDGRDAPELEAVVDAVMKLLPEIKSGTDGRDGVDGASVTIDDLRPILEAETARWQLEFERRAGDVLRHAVETMPRPENGRDGKDALSVEDFDVSLDGRIFTFALRCGERSVTKQIKVPFPVDKGVYRSGMQAEQGDVVTFGGALWIAKRDTVTKPPSDDWRLCVSKGRDGK